MTVYKTKDITLHDADGHAKIVVREDGDGLGMVDVHCSTDYYGKMNFSMDIDAAVMLAEAILEQAAYIKETH